MNLILGLVPQVPVIHQHTKYMICLAYVEWEELNVYHSVILRILSTAYFSGVKCVRGRMEFVPLLRSVLSRLGSNMKLHMRLRVWVALATAYVLFMGLVHLLQIPLRSNTRTFV